MAPRVGIGYDSHRFGEGDALVLGGVEVPHERGLTGHSDADVLTHAIMDALLGACGLGDIGQHFPPSEERWRDADSLDLLRTVLGMVPGRPVNVDATIVCEEPRLDPHRIEMEARLSEVLGAPVSVKATTNEGMGAIGRGEGIACFAVAMVETAHISLRAMLEGITSRLPLERISDGAWAVNVLRQRGLLAPMRPDKALRIGQRYVRWGTTPALGAAATAIKYPDEVAIADELGELTFGETHARSNALARGLADLGVGPGDGVAIMCRNSRYFAEATMATAKLGGVCLYLNTAFAAPQLAEVMERESTTALIYDEEFAELLHAESHDEVRRVVAWSDRGQVGDPTAEELIEANDRADLSAPPQSARYVILTSGTTGTPKGAQRGSPEGLAPVAAFLSKIPRSRSRRRPWSRRRSSTPGASATSSSACRWPRPWCFAAASTPRTRCGRSPSTARGPSRSCP